MGDFDFEPIRGVPAKLPDGEKILWQGEPYWLTLAMDVFHIRLIAIYFAAIAVWRIADGFYVNQQSAEILFSVLWVLPWAFAAIGILSLIAVFYAKTTVYTITNKRVIIRTGVAFSKAINIPFAKIASAWCKTYRAGTGDIPLTLSGNDKFSYIVLWPCARPWKFSKPEPMIRAIKNATEAANVLAEALAAEYQLQDAQAAKQYKNKAARPQGADAQRLTDAKRPAKESLVLAEVAE